MLSVRKQIRDKIKINLSNILLDNVPLKVLYDEPTVLQPGSAYIYIQSQGDSPEDSTIGFNTVLKHNLSLSISVVIKTASDLQDKLDDVASQIEVEMSKTKERVNLDGLVKRVILTSVESDLDDAQERKIGVITNVYSITYHTRANDPYTAL